MSMLCCYIIGYKSTSYIRTLRLKDKDRFCNKVIKPPGRLIVVFPSCLMNIWSSHIWLGKMTVTLVPNEVLKPLTLKLRGEWRVNCSQILNPEQHCIEKGRKEGISEAAAVMYCCLSNSCKCSGYTMSHG